MLAPDRGRLGPGSFLPDRIRCASLGIFCTYRFTSAGIVTALSDRFRSGGRFPAQQLSSFNPARPSTARLTGEMPPLREGDRYFGAAPPSAANCFPPSSPFLNLLLLNPVSSNWLTSIGLPDSLTQLIYEAAHTNIHNHSQRQEHKQH